MQSKIVLCSTKFFHKNIIFYKHERLKKLSNSIVFFTSFHVLVVNLPILGDLGGESGIEEKNW